ncbi:MAG: hypothetical protein ACI9LX_000432 [Paraglaciecola sp.]|jgi:hypothetical protein
MEQQKRVTKKCRSLLKFLIAKTLKAEKAVAEPPMTKTGEADVSIFFALPLAFMLADY